MPETVELAVQWGSQRRLMCPACKRYIKNAREDRTDCTRCGRVYLLVDGGWREVPR
jgi:hypothetical protein